ncbi:MAG: LegC family aminotransferase [Candidatus Omnitrophica bacterium]|nr:LegC family aminotransferase [Candidatus Omnitrophota bacterium]
MCKKMHLDAPNLGDLEKGYLNRAIDANFVSTVGPFVTEFEKRFAGYLGIRDAASTQSGTAAIHIALHELGIGAGDEVIVPALTFIATVNPVIYEGATPVFVDVDPLTWNIDVKEIERNITKKTKAVIPVHIYGNPCDMEGIMKVARDHNIYVIEDATESLGARYGSRHTGTIGNFGCFSFNGNKIITTGGGGMVVGKNVDSLNHIKFLVNQARDNSKEYYHPEIGFNDRMTNIEAALGLAQLERLDEFLNKKKLFNEIYRQELKSIESIRFQEVHENAESAYWLNSILFEKDMDIAVLQKRLVDRGIPTRRIFTPVIEFPPYKSYKKRDYKNSFDIYNRGLSLPSSTLNTPDDIDYICKALKEVM